MAAVLDERVRALEIAVHPLPDQVKDHEARLRVQEQLKAQLLGYAAAGAVVGGAVVEFVMKLLR